MRVAETQGSGRRRSWVALLLAAALLVCHGLLGASHVLAHEDEPRPGSSPAAGEEHPAAHSPGSGHASSGPAGPEPATGGEGEAPHVGAVDYFAVLLALLGAAALGLLRAVVRAPLVNETSRIFRPYPRFATRPPPRGPSPSLLQVFRL